MKLLACLFISFLLLPCQSARADLILGNVTNTIDDTAATLILVPDAGISVGLQTKSQISLSSVEFYLKANNLQSGFIAKLTLRADDNSKPGSTLSTFDLISIPPTDYQKVSFTPSASLLLDANATYWFTLESNFTASDAALHIGAGTINPTATSFASFSGTRFGPSNDQSNVSPFAPTFQVNGITAVPEPTSLVLVSSPLLYLLHRRRKAGLKHSLRVESSARN